MYQYLLLLLCMITFAAQALPVTETAEQTQLDYALNSTDAYANANYDQRQFGKYNIHLSIKDVNIIEMEPSAQAEYFYDDSEYYYDDPQTAMPLDMLTSIKPQTTKGSTASSEKPNVNEETTLKIMTNAPTNLVTQALSVKETHTDLLQDNQANESPIYRMKMQQQQENLKQMQHMKNDFVQQLQDNAKQIPILHPKQLIFPLRKSQQQQKNLVKNLINYPNPIVHQFHTYRCRAHQYRDLNGNCHARRSSNTNTNSATAILRKFFNMLVGLPNVRESMRE